MTAGGGLAFDPEGQRRFWGGRLAVDNVGASSAADGVDLAAELAFLDTPDQRHATARLEPGPGRAMLDLGAGLGVNALKLARAGSPVVAADVSGLRLRGAAALAGKHGTGAGTGAGRVMAVQCAAEALPFRAGAFAGATTRSVLIHTDLPRAVAELRRVMAADGVGVFTEPMTRNPLVNLYRRTLAPKEWMTLARYFAEPELAVFRAAFERMETRRWYLTAFLGFGFQFAVKSPRLFGVAVGALNGLDRWLMARRPRLARLAWFVTVEVGKED